MSDNNSDKNKVVQFPIHKVRKGADSDQTKGQAYSHKKKVTLLVSLVSTIFIATLINSRINLSQAPSRGLASYEGDSERDISEDIRLAKKIARESLRQPASRGRAPTTEEKLQFETLNRSYSLNLNDKGALVAIVYNENAGQIRKLPNRAKFLKENNDLLKLNFDDVEAEPIRTSNEKYKFEVYDLKKSGSNTAVTRVHFTFDHEDHFISMRVESGT